MHGLAVNLTISLSGHLSNIDEIMTDLILISLSANYKRMLEYQAPMDTG